MTKIALFGAGGTMGRTLSAALKDREYDMRYVEISEAGADRSIICFRRFDCEMAGYCR